MRVRVRASVRARARVGVGARASVSVRVGVKARVSVLGRAVLLAPLPGAQPRECDGVAAVEGGAAYDAEGDGRDPKAHEHEGGEDHL